MPKKATAPIDANDMSARMRALANDAREAYHILADSKNEEKDMALVAAAMSLRERTPEILAANAKDMEAGKAQGLNAAQLDRLQLSKERVEAMAQGLETIATLPDPINKVIDEWERPNGLVMQKVSIPIGVIGMIYESRPNVTADAAGLCIKSGNAVILRGGSESVHSSHAILESIHLGLKTVGLPETCVQLVPDADRAWVSAMLAATGLIDVIIPRGGKSLNAKVQAESKVPTLLHLDGNCHTYVHASADSDMARDILLNAKMRRTGICGATESLLIDEACADRILPILVNTLVEKGCEVRGDKAAQAIDKHVKPASDEDFDTEYLDAIISVKVVDDLEEAIAHINAHGSNHTDAIIAEDKNAARQFLRQVDSAIVMHNTSTQFADGGEFGFGSEIGISNGRLHARGPVGAEQLTTYKYVVHGEGQLRD